MGWTLDDTANNSPWLVGPPHRRGIYAQDEDGSTFIGVMETEGIATDVVAAHNGAQGRPEQLWALAEAGREWLRGDS